MAKYYVFHYSEQTSKNGDVYVNLDFVPDNDQERVLPISIRKDYFMAYDDVKNLDPISIKKYWFDLFTYWDNQYHQRRLNGIRKIGQR